MVVDVCLARSEKLNFGELPNIGLAAGAAVDPNENVDAELGAATDDDAAGVEN